MSKIIMDVSTNQQVIDFALLKKEGQNKIIIKAGNGRQIKDAKFEDHYKNAKQNDFNVAAYFWLDPIYDATAQCKFLLSIIAEKDIDFIALDFEQYWASWDDWSKMINKKITMSQVRKISPDRLLNHLIDCCKFLDNNTDLKIVIYSARWFVDGYCPKAYDFLKNRYTWWADYSYYDTTRYYKPWAELEKWTPNSYPHLPNNFPKDNVVLWQWSGDKFSSDGIWSTVYKAYRSLLDLNVWINDNITWETLSNKNVQVEDDTGENDFMIEIDKKTWVLNVPYVSQLESGATAYNNDCGAASSVMLLKAYNKSSPSVDEFYKKTGAVGDVYLSATQLINVLSFYGLATHWKISSMNELMTNLRNEKPMICLISYATLKDAGLTQSSFRGFHFIVVVGYDTKNIYVNDPLWTGIGGKNLAIPFSIFEKSWKDAGANPAANPAFGSIIPDENLSGINVDTESMPTIQKYKVIANTLNIRPTSSITYAPIGSFTKNTVVNIEKIENGWGKLYNRSGWVSMTYLVKI